MPPPTSGGGDRIHVVQPGQNLFRIALQYGMDVNTLAQYNNIANPHVIYVGQKIRIPGSGGSGPGGYTYTVQPGDTLTNIAMRFNTTVAGLKSANNLTSDIIYVGQVLNIP